MPIYPEYFKSAKVIILYKSNEREVAEKIRRELKDYAYATKIVLLSNIDNLGLNRIVKDEYELNKLKQKIYYLFFLHLKKLLIFPHSSEMRAHRFYPDIKAKQHQKQRYMEKLIF